MAELTELDLTQVPAGEEARWLAAMDGSSRTRVEGIRSPERRRQAAAGDWLARRAVAKRTGLAPERVRILRAAGGKPWAEGCCFSVSHSGGWVVCAAGPLPLGVDTEELRPFDPAVAERCFSDLEREYLDAAPAGARRQARFWRIWTGKEALAKLEGGGLASLRRQDTRGPLVGVRLQWREERDHITCIAEREPLAERALGWLRRRGGELFYLDLIGPILCGRAEILAAGEEGVLLRQPESGGCFLAAESPAAGRTMLEKLDGDCSFLMLHQRSLCAQAEARLGFRLRMRCRQVAPRGGERLVPLPPGLTVREAEERDLPLITAHYDKETPEMLRKLAWTGDLLVAEAAGRVTGFMGLHPEGCLGLLCVLPEYRRRGYAAALESVLLQRELRRGFCPYGQVESENEGSLRLQQKLGLSLSERELFLLAR
ncbi:MAG: GNAT family N-acetyltransferase [Oscillospiraceae bacterium]